MAAITHTAHILSQHYTTRGDNNYSLWRYVHMFYTARDENKLLLYIHRIDVFIVNTHVSYTGCRNIYTCSNDRNSLPASPGLRRK